MPRAGLTTATVVEAALAILDDEGPDAVTLAAVADRLGVRSPSLYRHVEGLDGLHDGMAAQVVGELADAVATAEAACHGSPRAAVRAALIAYRDWARTWPRRYALVPVTAATSPALAEAGDRLVAQAVGWVAAWGLEGDDAIHAVRALRSLVHGFCAIEAADGFGLPVDVDASYERLLDVHLAGLDARAGVH